MQGATLKRARSAKALPGSAQGSPTGTHSTRQSLFAELGTSPGYTKGTLGASGRGLAAQSTRRAGQIVVAPRQSFSGRGVRRLAIVRGPSGGSTRGHGTRRKQQQQLQTGGGRNPNELEDRSTGSVSASRERQQ